MKVFPEHNTAGRTAVVTGASSGIGEAFARRLARNGYGLVLAARRADRLAEIARELERVHHVPVRILPADLSTDEGIAALEHLMESDATIEVLVNSAGFGTRGLFAELKPEKIRNMVHLHTMAVARLTRAALPLMIENHRGYIVNVSSIGAFLTTSHYTTYSATKAFVNMFTLGLRDELAGTGILLQALCPGLTRTGFMYTDEYRDFDYSMIPGFAWMTPEQVVDESLAALRKNKIIFIPGRGNRLFVATLRAPVIGAAFGWMLSMLGRGKNAY
jgi:short-subunit dehydrogenase